jgi:hypothetical protein
VTRWKPVRYSEWRVGYVYKQPADGDVRHVRWMLLDDSTHPWLGAAKYAQRGKWGVIHGWTNGRNIKPGDPNPDFLERRMTKRELAKAVALKLAHYGGVK